MMKLSMSYSTRVIRRLGPYSKSQSFPELLGEWYATGIMEDVDDAQEECDVCGHEHIRYLFQIKNRLNSNIREKSGSKCIIKFPEIGVLDGQRITHDPVEKEKLLNEIIERHKKEQRARIRKEVARQVSVGLQGKEAMQAPIGAMRDISNKVYYNAGGNGLFTPKQFSLFVWAAQIAKIEVPLAAFQGIMNLRKGRSKDQLDGLHWRQIENIKGALTPSQLTILERERKASPPG